LIRDGRDGPDVQAERHPALDGLPNGNAGGAGHRDQQARGARDLDGLVHRPEAAKDGQPGDDAPRKRRVVVDEPDGTHTRTRITRRRARHEDTGIAGPVQQRRLAVGSRHPRLPGHAVCSRPDPEPNPPQDRDAEQQLDGPEGPREAIGPAAGLDHGRPVEDDDRHERAEARRSDDPDELRHACEPPSAAIHAKVGVDRRSNRKQQEHDQREGRNLKRGADPVKAQSDGEVGRHDDAQEIDREEVPPPDVPCHAEDSLNRGSGGHAPIARKRRGTEPKR
jgi:hypothetical protein